jgi:hypothetical protein
MGRKEVEKETGPEAGMPFCIASRGKWETTWILLQPHEAQFQYLKKNIGG